ncbi:MAG: CBS domain-containing protein [Nanoarchaeota archaeon]
MVSIIKVRDWMTSPVMSVHPEENVQDIAVLMDKNDIGAVVVMTESQQLCGILTQRDLIAKVLSKGKDAKATSAKDIMSKEVITVTPEASLLEVSKMMNKYHIGNVVVLENNKVVGIITARDLIELVSS